MTVCLAAEWLVVCSMMVEKGDEYHNPQADLPHLCPLLSLAPSQVLPFVHSFLLQTCSIQLSYASLAKISVFRFIF